MLRILSNKFKKMKWENVCPYIGASDGELLLMMSEDIGFRLLNIVVDDKEEASLSLNKFIIDKLEIFGRVKLNDRLQKFLPIFNTRLERLFVTKKSEYLFFDLEEQNFLRALFDGISVSAQVEILIREDKELRLVEFDNISSVQYARVKRHFKSAGVVFVMNPADLYYLRKQAGQLRKEITPEERTQERINILKKYPLLNVDSQDSFKNGFRTYSKKFHPDTGGNDKVFSEFKKAVNFLKGTKWYKIKIEGVGGDGPIPSNQ